MKNLYLSFVSNTQLGVLIVLFALMAFPFAEAFAQPANDQCGGAITVACGSSTTGTTVASTNTDEPGTCGPTGITANGVWYVFVGTGDIVTIDLCGATAYDSKLHIYSGACGSANLTCIDSEDDDPNCPTNNPTITFVSSVGINYYFYINGFSGATGSFVLDVNCTPPPTNNDCATAISLAQSATCTPTSGSLLGLTASPPVPACGTTPVAADAWYSFSATSTDAIVATTSGFSPIIEVFSGTCATPVPLTCSNAIATASVTGLTIGTTYFVRIAVNGSTFPADPGFDICISTPPSNDLCANAIPVTCGNTYSGSTIGASTTGEPNPGVTCGTAISAPGVWYVFSGNGDIVTVDLCNAPYDSKLSVYLAGSPTCTAFTCIGGEDDDNTFCVGNDPYFSFSTIIGRDFYIYVNGFSGGTGTFDLSVACSPPPTNDNCTQAVSITQNTTCVPTSGTLLGLMTSTPAACTGTSASDGWYSFVATSTNPTIEVNPAFDAVTEVFAACPATTTLYCSDPNTIMTTGLTIGATYFIRVGTFSSTVPSDPSFAVCVKDGPIPPPTCGPSVPASNVCASAPVIQSGNAYCSTTFAPPTHTATTPGNLSTAFCGSIENNSFYQFSAMATTAVFDWWSTGCSSGVSGPQFQVFSVDNCAGASPTWTAQSSCVTDNTNPASPGTQGTITATGLTPGNTYYLMADGFGGNVCDYVLRVAGGVTFAVDWGDFSGENAGSRIELDWSTFQESNNHFFEVERSQDRTVFSKIGMVSGNGNSQSATSYTFSDLKPEVGANYYRLRQVDFDGSFSYSAVVAVNFAPGSLTEVYPNPFSNLLHVNLGEIQRQATFNLFTVTGATVWERSWDAGQEGDHTLDLSDLPTGIYYYQVRNGNELIRDRITKTK